MTDLSSFDEVQPTSQHSIKNLLDLANELVQLETQMESLEELMKTISSRANALKTAAIPDAMAEAGLSEFKTPEGARLKIEDFVSGSLPKEPTKRVEAIAAVEAWGAGGIIKNEVSLFFERSQHNEAMALVDDLRQRGLACELVSTIHPQTYLATIRKRLAEGDEVDADRMGVFIGRKTKVTLPKGSK